MKRRRFLRLRERYARRGKRFVYLDESGFAPTSARRYGYAPKGKRVYGEFSGNKRPRTSLLAARIDTEFTATFLFEGTCGADIFNLWLARELCPLLGPNDVVILDNAAFHKSQTTRDLVVATGATLLFLPPYSPDLNPIEHDFGALKKIREYNHETPLDHIIKEYK
jgi:transposase